jgi:hypothetical protein
MTQEIKLKTKNLVHRNKTCLIILKRQEMSIKAFSRESKSRFSKSKLLLQLRFQRINPIMMPRNKCTIIIHRLSKL